MGDLLTINIEALDSAFLEQGCAKLKFPREGIELLRTVRTKLLERLNEVWHLELESLDDYHKKIVDDDQHIKIQADLTDYYQQQQYGVALVCTLAPILRQFVGLDLQVQKYPYLRIARPNKAQDNIGFHRDTHYGSSPYEVSLHVPITDPGIEGSLAYYAGSHTLPDSELPFTQVQSADVAKGSVKHKLGFVYAPKVMGDETKSKVKPIHVGVGELMAFALGLVHGQEVNRGTITRFSTDIRVVNALAPVNWGRNVHGDYYMPLCTSGLTAQAQKFLVANAA